MGTPLFQVDAFSDRPFAGNPAAVALLTAPTDAGWMQQVAAEMNLAETAFVERHDVGRYGLRWFTPEVEVDLCGHATLASAHVLWSEGHDTSDVLRFATRSGELRARRVGDRIELDLPAAPAVEQAIDPGVVTALQVDPVRTGATANGWLVVELAAAADVRAAAPDLGRLAAATADGAIITAPGDGGVDVVSRVFVPAAGIPEDPVTGAAHCVLAPWWWDRIGADRIEAEQASARGGRLTVVLDGDRVRLQGAATTTLRGELTVE